MYTFKNRTDAGAQLAKALAARIPKDSNVAVLALPRGGVPVAAEVAKALNSNIDVLIVRKLGMPFDPEFAFGALSIGGALWVDQRLIDRFAITESAREEVMAAETKELARRELKYRGTRVPLHLQGKTVIVVDDGIATGASMKAALIAARKLKPKRLILAVPVAPASAESEFENMVDDYVCVLNPIELQSVASGTKTFLR